MVGELLRSIRCLYGGGGAETVNGLSAIDPPRTLGPPAMHPGKRQVKMCNLRQHVSSKLI